MEKEKNTKDVFVECKNLLFGETKFLCFKIPESWFVNPVPYNTDVENWKKIEGEKWVTEGYTQLCLLPGRKNGPLFLFIKASGYDEELRVEEWLIRKKSSVREKKGEELIDSGLIQIQNHKAAYLAYTRSTKKFLLFGKENKETLLKVLLKCDKTQRMLSFKVSSKLPGYLSSAESLNKLLNVFSTFICH